MHSAFEDVEVLFFEGFAGASCNLTTEVDGVARGRVVQVGASVFSLEEGCIKNVGGGVGERGDGGWFRGDFGEEVEKLRDWVGGLVRGVSESVSILWLGTGRR